MSDDLNKYYPYEEEFKNEDNENNETGFVLVDPSNQPQSEGQIQENDSHFTEGQIQEDAPSVDNKSGGQIHNNRKGGFAKFLAGSLVGAILGGAIAGGGIIGYLNMNKNEMDGQLNTSEIRITNQGANAVTAVAAKAGPSVVGINVTSLSNDFFFGSQTQSGSGSGIIIRKDGYIMTNQHVIEAALDNQGKQRSNAKVEVVLPNGGKSYAAKIVGHDVRTDLAVLKIEENNLPAILFADSSKLQVGDDVVAIGNPGGEELMGSVTSGVVSGLNRTLGAETREIKLIQTDASINPGNSGGALCNMNGELVGVNSSKIVNTGYEGIGFAIPSNDAKRIVDSLIENKYVKGRPFLGIQFNPQWTKEVAERYKYPEGVLISQVVPFTGASNAGLQINDIITEFNGVRVKNINDLEGEKNKLKPGDVVKVKYFRNEEYFTVNVTITEEKNN